MALEFEDQTPTTITNRMNADVKISAPRSNPTKKNSFVGAFVKGLAYRVYDFYRQLGKLKTECFPDTSTIDGELKRWGSYRNITQTPETGATGSVIVTGDEGATLDAGETATLDSVTYETTAAVTIVSQSFAILTMTRSSTTVTATTSTSHNLCSSLEATITGATSSIFNGTFDITVISDTQFTYTVDGDDLDETASGTIQATFLLAFATVEVSNDSDVSGDDSNQDAGTAITLDSTVDGINNELLVSYNGLSGGADLEDDDEYRERVIEAYQNPVANFNEAAIIQQIKQEVANVTRVWVQPITPIIGEVTIYFACDNTGIIPTGTDVSDVETAVYAILPCNTPEAAVHVYAPTALYIDFDFATLEPSTVAMRTAITERLEELFYTSAEVETTLTAELYRAKIANTVDTSGATVESFSLTAPLGDIVPDSGELPVLQNVTFADGEGEVYIAVMFDGDSGRSDGTTDGYSQELTGTGFLVDISVTGVFDGATVTMQLYDSDSDSWSDTSVSWTDEGDYNGLYVDSNVIYRLNISDADTNTDIAAEVLYG